MMRLFGPKKPKTELDLIEDQLKFWRRRVSSITGNYEATKRIIELENHLIKMHSIKIPERIKALEEAIGELYLLGREEKNGSKD